MTAISRRNALVSAGAAMAVAGVPGAVLGDADPQFEALISQLRETYARLADIGVKRRDALGLIPTAIQEANKAYCRAGVPLPTDVTDAYNRHYEASGVKALDEESDKVCDRISDIEAQITQTPAMTLRGVLAKTRVAWHITAMDGGFDETDPDFDGNCCRLDDPVFIWSILRDLERLAEDARS